MKLRTLFALIWVPASLVLVLAGVAWTLWGSFAAGAVITVTVGLAGLTKALIELSIRIDQSQQLAAAEQSSPTIAAPSRTSIGIAATLGLAIGVTLGFFLLPWLIERSVRPSVSISVPARVAMRERIDVRWRNLPAGQCLHVLTRTLADGVYFPQRCRSTGERRGRMNCDVEIGGTEDAGKMFEIAAVMATGTGSCGSNDPLFNTDYFRTLPSGTAVMAARTVARQR